MTARSFHDIAEGRVQMMLWLHIVVSAADFLAAVVIAVAQYRFARRES
eukprot:gene3222-2030_t